MAGKRANLTVLLKLNSSRFKKGLASARADAVRFAKGVGSLGLKAARAAMVAFTAAAAAAAGAMVVGVKKALDFGGRMSDVADQTGLSVTNIMIWEEALRQGGQSAEEFGNIVNKMQKSIFDFSKGLSTQRDAFKELGIGMEELTGKKADEQLELISDRLVNIADDAKRVGIARDIFGRSGAKLFTTINDGDALEKAKKTLGEQLEIYERQAKTFDRISDIMGSIGVKMRGFFAGVADKLAPMLLEIAEKFDKLDLAAKGQAFGNAMAGFFQNIAMVPDLLKTGLLLAATHFTNAIRIGLAGALSGLVAGVYKLISPITDILNITLPGFGEIFDTFDQAFGKDMFKGSIDELQKDLKEMTGDLLRPKPVAGGSGGAAGVAGQPGGGILDPLGNKRASIPALLGLRRRTPSTPPEFPGLDGLAALQLKNNPQREQRKQTGLLSDIKNTFDAMAHNINREFSPGAYE